jgi:hypothetical protein
VWLCDSPPDDADGDEDTGWLLGEVEVDESALEPAIEVTIPPDCVWVEEIGDA